MRQLLKLIVIIPTLFCISSYSQSNKLIDSLKIAVTKSISDSERVVTYYRLSKQYVQLNDSTNSVNTLFKGILLAQKRQIAKLIPMGFNEIGYLYELMDEQKLALKYYNQAVLNAKKYDNQLALGISYNNISFVYKGLNQITKAISYSDSGFIAFQKSGSKKNMGLSANNSGLWHHMLNEDEKALMYFNRAIKIYDEINEEKLNASTTLNIGLVNLRRRNYDIALDYFNQAKILANKTNFTVELMRIENNVGAVYIEQKKYQKAISIFLELKDLSKKYNNKEFYANSLNNLAVSYSEIQDFVKSEIFFKENELLTIKAKDFEGLVINYINYSGSIGKQKNYDKSLEYSFKALNYINSNEGLGRYKQNVFENIASCYKEKGDLIKAFNYQDSQYLAKDIFINEKSNKELLNLQVKYETERKELKIAILNKSDSIKSLAIANQQIAINKNLYDIASQKLALADAGLQLADDSLQLSIKNETILQNRLDSTQKEERIQDLNKQKRIQELEVNRKNTTIIALSVFTVLILLLGYSFYKRKTLQQQATMQAALAMQQQKATIEIINAEEKERKRIAEDLHDGVGQLMTAAWLNLQALDDQLQVDNSPQYQLVNKTLLLVDESCKEVRQVSHNMMPNALLRKGLVNAVKEFIGQINTGKLSIKLQTEELQKALPSHVETILYRVIQESVNNVVKHAEATQLDISINQDDGGIDVMIEDNGKGFDTTITRETDGIGLQNIRSRILYLKGTVTWDSSANNGTLVAIHIPTNA